MKKKEWIAVILVMFIVSIAVSSLTIKIMTGETIRVAESKKGIIVYSKAEIDSKLTNIYTKTEVDQLTSSKGVTTSNSNYYSREEVDSKLTSTSAEILNAVYNKTQIDSRLDNLYSNKAEISGIKFLSGAIYAAFPYNLQLGQDNGFGRVTIEGELVTKLIPASSGQELYYACLGADGQILQSSVACR